MKKSGCSFDGNLAKFLKNKEKILNPAAPTLDLNIVNCYYWETHLIKWFIEQRLVININVWNVKVTKVKVVVSIHKNVELLTAHMYHIWYSFPVNIICYICFLYPHSFQTYLQRTPMLSWVVLSYLTPGPASTPRRRGPSSRGTVPTSLTWALCPSIRRWRHAARTAAGGSTHTQTCKTK